MPELINKPTPVLYESPWWSRLAAISEQGERAVIQSEHKVERSSFRRTLAALLPAIDGGGYRNIFLKLN
jgi:hypothetical protein